MKPASKICLVFSGGFKGGAEVLMLEFYHLLLREGFECELILNGEGEVKDYCKSSNIKFRSVSYKDFGSWKWPFPYFLRVLGARQLFRNSDSLLYFVEGKVLTQVFALAGKLTGTKVVSYVHFPPSKWEAKRVLYYLCHRVLLCCGALSNYLRGFVDQDQISVVKNFVDSEKFLPGSKLEKLPVSILLVGHLSKVKGQVVAIEALALLRDEGCEVELILAGADNSIDQRNRHEIENLIKSLELDEQVKLLGKVDNVSELYQNSDIFLLPSLKEGLPLVVLEAMASGLPVVASAVDGTPEAVVNGETGLLLLGEVSAVTIKDALKKLVGDSSLRSKMGKAGRKRVEDEFSKARYERELMGVVYNSLGQHESE